METPKTKEGRVTERIMGIFRDGDPVISWAEAEQYNRVWAHVLKILEQEYPSRRTVLDARKMVCPGDEPLA